MVSLSTRSTSDSRTNKTRRRHNILYVSRFGIMHGRINSIDTLLSVLLSFNVLRMIVWIVDEDLSSVADFLEPYVLSPSLSSAPVTDLPDYASVQNDGNPHITLPPPSPGRKP